MKPRKRSGRKSNGTLSSSTEAALIKGRGSVYGDPRKSHEDIAHVWHALLESWYQIKLPPLPPHVVAAMMAGMKLCRLTKPFGYDSDSAADARVYVQFAHEFRQADVDTSASP